MDAHIDGSRHLFQLLPWQTLLAGGHAAYARHLHRGDATHQWSIELVALLGYSSLIGMVLAYWAMNTVNRGLPASVTSMALLGVPVMGLLGSSVMLGERPDAALLLATGLIVAGVAVGTFGRTISKVSA